MELEFQQNYFLCKNKKSFDNAYKEFLRNYEIKELNIVNSKPEALFRHFKKEFKIIEAAGGLVFNRRGEILIIKRQGFWDLPKGKIEKDEGKKMAAIREVQEECGIEGLDIISKIGKTFHTYQLNGVDILKITHWYKMVYSGEKIPTPQIEEDITEVGWIVIDKLGEIICNTHKSLIHIFETIRKE